MEPTSLRRRRVAAPLSATSSRRRPAVIVEGLELRTLFNGTPPIANADPYGTAEDTSLIVAAPGVLANDIEPSGEPMVAVLVSGPAHGTVALNANGAFSYMPAANFNGIDSFSYNSRDPGGLDSNVVPVTITVSPVNDPPTAGPEFYNVTSGTAFVLNAPGVLGNDSDIDGNPLAAVLVSAPAHGSLTFFSNGAFTYTSAPGYVGPDSFTYRATDGAATSNVATVQFNVLPALNVAPVADNDSYTLQQDTSLIVSAPGVLGNDADADGDPLTAVLVSGPAHGTLTLNADGAFTYAPAPGYAGADSFTYRASDGALTSNVATVSLDVQALTAQEHLQNLLDDVAALQSAGDINNGQFHSLVNKLTAAIDRLDDGRTDKGIRKIEDFIDEVERLSSGGHPALTAAQGQALIDAAEAAIAAAV